MPRPRRRDFPGATLHVTNVGISNRTVFERSRDVRYFLSLLARAVRQGEILVHAYALLTTHFHLLLTSATGNLSGAMGRIQARYSKYFNRTRGRQGTLYQRRYYSKIVDSRPYLDNLVRYIDGNAVRAGLVARPDWHICASAYWYARERAPKWLSRELLIGRTLEKSGARAFTPEVYRRVFAPRLSQSLEAYIERRIARGDAVPDPLSDLMDAAPTDILAWMFKQAQRADATRPGLPLVPWEELLEVVRDARSRVQELDGRWKDGRSCPREQILLAGLLRDIGGLSYAQIGTLAGCSSTAAYHRYKRHAAMLADDTEYATLAASVTHQAVCNNY